MGYPDAFNWRVRRISPSPPSPPFNFRTDSEARPAATRRIWCRKFNAPTIVGHGPPRSDFTDRRHPSPTADDPRQEDQITRAGESRTRAVGTGSPESCLVRGSSALVLFCKLASYPLFRECDVIDLSTEQMYGRATIHDVTQHLVTSSLRVARELRSTATPRQTAISQLY